MPNDLDNLPGGREGGNLNSEALKKAQKEQQAKAMEIASQFHQCFSTDAGQYVLERLKTVTINRPVLDPNSTQFGAGMREGENSLVRQILAQIELAEQQ